MKQFNRFSVLAIAVLSFSLSAHAGNEGGHGGNSVVCFRTEEIANQVKKNGENIIDDYLDDITFIEVLDLYEAKKPQGEPAKQPELVEMAPDWQITYSEGRIKRYIDTIYNRFYYNVYALARYIEHGEQTFIDSRIRRKKLFKVDDINPVGPLDDEKKCVYATIAKQVGNFLYLDPRLYDHKLHSEWSKAVLRLHEYVRLQSLYVGQEDALKTRQLVEMMITRNLGMTVGELWAQIESMGFKHDPKPDILSAANKSPFYIINQLKFDFLSTDIMVCSYDEELRSWRKYPASKRPKAIAEYMSDRYLNFMFNYNIGKINEIDEKVKDLIKDSVHCAEQRYEELAKKATCSLDALRYRPVWKDKNGKIVDTPLSTMIRGDANKCYEMNPILLTWYKIK